MYWQGTQYKIFKYNGDPIWHEKTAEKLLNKIRAEIDDNTFQPKTYFSESPLSISEYAILWLKAIDVKPNTLKDYTYSVRKFIKPYFKDKDIRNIRHGDLVEFYKWIPRAEKGKYNVMSCLRTMMRWAWRNEDIPKVPPFPRLTQGELPQVKYLTMDQQQTILRGIPERHRAIFMFGMGYGLRIGELRALMWDCVEGNEFFVKRAFGDNLLQESTKTGRIRRYGLTSYAKEILKSLKVISPKFIFVRDDGKPYTDKDLNRIWSAACEKAGVEKIKLYNAVRHSLGCQLLDEGVEFDKVQKILGHARSEMTNRYAKRTEARLTEVLEKHHGVVSFTEHLLNENKTETI